MTQLPENTDDAFDVLIAATQDVLEAMKAENDAIDEKNSMMYMELQKKKQEAVARHEALANEFHDRLGEFQEVSAQKKAELENLLRQLRQETARNLDKSDKASKAGN